MRMSARMLCAFVLALFAFSVAAAASDCPRGDVLYRQSFEELSYPDIAGIKKGTDGEDGFDIYVSDNALCLDSYDDRKSYVIFPCIPPETDYTIEYTFSFSEVDSANAYAAFMLTSKGDAPDNITSAVIRVNGTCDGFGTFSEALTEKIASGEKTSVCIPVEKGTYHEITVSCGELTETVFSENITDIPVGKIGFGYKARTGVLKNTSTWNNKNPYSNSAETEMLRITCMNDGENELPTAPQTSDPLGIFALLFGLSAAGAAVIFKKIY